MYNRPTSTSQNTHITTTSRSQNRHPHKHHTITTSLPTHHDLTVTTFPNLQSAEIITNDPKIPDKGEVFSDDGHEITLIAA